MAKMIFDYGKGDVFFKISDNMATDSNGNLYTSVSDRLIFTSDGGVINRISDNLFYDSRTKNTEYVIRY